MDNDVVIKKLDEYIGHCHNIFAGNYDDPVQARKYLNILLNDLNSLISEHSGLNTSEYLNSTAEKTQS